MIVSGLSTVEAFYELNGQVRNLNMRKSSQQKKEVPNDRIWAGWFILTASAQEFGYLEVGRGLLVFPSLVLKGRWRPLFGFQILQLHLQNFFQKQFTLLGVAVARERNKYENVRM